MTPQERYTAETGKDVWKIKNHTYTDEYVKWVKCYAKKSNSIEAKLVRHFANKLKFNNNK